MDIGNIAELNTFLVLDAIRSRGHVTRRQLGSELRLSDASVSRIVKRLLAAGLIAEEPRAGAEAGVGAGAARGRIPAVLRFVEPPGGVIGVDLGGTRCHGALADLAGGVVTEDFRPAGEGSEAVGALLGCVATLRARAAELGMPVRAAVVGIPALIDPASGLATAGPNVHWQGLDLLGMLRERLTLPFEVDNDVSLGALGQAWRGAGRGAHSFVLISLGTGIGGAVVIDGHLIRGRHNAAGEVAYFPVGRGGAAGRAGFEDVASGTALRARAAELIAAGRPSSLAAQTGAAETETTQTGGAETETTQTGGAETGAAQTGAAEYAVADIFTAARAEDQVGVQVVTELVGHVAATIVGATALVDPERIILDGSIGRALEPWIGDLRSAVAAGVFRPPDLVVSTLGANATVLGAIARALAIVAELDQPPVRRPLRGA